VAWQQVRDDTWTLAGQIVINQRKNGQWRVFTMEQDKRLYIMGDNLTADYARGVAEDEARTRGLGALTRKNARWQNDLPTEGQARYLWRLGERTASKQAKDGTITKGEAAQAITTRLVLDAIQAMED
jgi:archaeosine-15-forming tRNA-guanine transglycosylase